MSVTFTEPHVDGSTLEESPIFGSKKFKIVLTPKEGVPFKLTVRKKELTKLVIQGGDVYLETRKAKNVKQDTRIRLQPGDVIEVSAKIKTTGESLCLRFDHSLEFGYTILH